MKCVTLANTEAFRNINSTENRIFDNLFIKECLYVALSSTVAQQMFITVVDIVPGIAEHTGKS